MVNFLVGTFVVLHGLVHLWYVTLSQQIVEFQREMGWTGESWLLPQTLQESAGRTLASLLFTAAAVAFVVTGAGIYSNASWWRAALAASAVLSSVSLVLFWDGSPAMLVQKGGLAFVINVIFLAVVAAMA